MKRIALALVVAAVLFGAVYASAAALDVFGGVIQQGADDDLTCASAIYVAGWGVDSETGEVANVRFDTIPGECANVEVFVDVYDTSGAWLTKGSETVANMNGYRVYFDNPVQAEAIGKIQVTLEGGA